MAVDKKAKAVQADGISLQARGGVQAQWSSGDHLDPMFSDHLHLSRINDQFYLTFGQLRPGIDQPDGTVSPITAEIRPLIRLIVPRDALAKVVALLTKGLESKVSETK